MLETLKRTWMWWAPPVVILLLITAVVMVWLGFVSVPGPDYAVF